VKIKTKKPKPVAALVFTYFIQFNRRLEGTVFSVVRA
jgi:hypothetical protein